MACVVGEADDYDDDSAAASEPGDEAATERTKAATGNITFLYTLESGASPRSFGVSNVDR